MSCKGSLTGNILKIIAAMAMTLDHAGLLLFPGNMAFRIIGRLAFPIFAFMIAEGCKYTHNRRKYLQNLLFLATACQIVYFIADGSLYLSILFTFSLSVGMIYLLQYWRTKPTALSALAFFAGIITVYLLNQWLTIDYGFWGCMMPVFAALPHGTKYDDPKISALAMIPALAILSLYAGSTQIWSLAAIPLLLLYSGKRGKYKMKMFFYIFYPAHLALLQVIAWIWA